MAIIWLATFSTTTVILFPAVLLSAGLVLEFYFERFKKAETDRTDFRKLPFSQIGLYASFALAVMLVTGYGVQYVSLPSLSAFPDTSTLLYTTSIAVAEEQFFRGFVTDSLVSYHTTYAILNNVYAKLILSGAIFMAYHYARYGSSGNDMLYVLVGGTMLSWIAYKTQRLSPSMLAHVFNNILALVGGIIK